MAVEDKAAFVYSVNEALVEYGGKDYFAEHPMVYFKDEYGDEHITQDGEKKVCVNFDSCTEILKDMCRNSEKLGW